MSVAKCCCDKVPSGVWAPYQTDLVEWFQHEQTLQQTSNPNGSRIGVAGGGGSSVGIGNYGRYGVSFAVTDAASVLPPGVTILAAELRGQWSAGSPQNVVGFDDFVNTPFQSWDINLYGRLDSTLSPLDFPPQSGSPGMTLSTVAWQQADLPPEVYDIGGTQADLVASVNIGSIVQEIVNDPSWTLGGTMSLYSWPDNMNAPADTGGTVYEGNVLHEGTAVGFFRWQLWVRT